MAFKLLKLRIFTHSTMEKFELLMKILASALGPHEYDRQPQKWFLVFTTLNNHHLQCGLNLRTCF